jgi:hypothetical protein
LSLFTRDAGPDKPYIVVPVAEYVLGKDTNITITNQTTPIIDIDNFTRVLADAAFSKTFYLSVKGSTTAHLGALKANLRLEKDIQLNGKLRRLLRKSPLIIIQRARYAERIFYRLCSSRSPS